MIPEMVRKSNGFVNERISYGRYNDSVDITYRREFIPREVLSLSKDISEGRVDVIVGTVLVNTAKSYQQNRPLCRHKTTAYEPHGLRTA